MYTHAHSLTPPPPHHHHHYNLPVVSKEEITLQQQCIQVISQSVTSVDDAKQLPLPEKFQEAIRDNYSQVYTGFVPERYKKVWNYLFEEKKYRKNTSARFFDFFKFCMIDKQRKSDPHFFERMERRAQEDREGGGGERGLRRRRDRDYFYEDFLFEGSPWKNKEFWT